MSYRIDYSAAQPQKGGGGSVRPWLLTLCAFCLFCLLIHAFWQPGADLLGRLLLGEGHERLLTVLEKTLQQAGEGVPLRQAAVGAFRELIHGG